MVLKLISKSYPTTYTESKILLFALFVRIVVVILTVVSDYLAEDYDSSCTLFLNNEALTPFQTFYRSFLKGFIRWDAVHFLSIAYNNGYTFEQQFAFFPGLPLLMRLFAGTLLKPLSLLGLDAISLLAFSGILISNLSSILSSWVLFKLTQKTFKTNVFAFVSALLYSCTPTPLFMSSIYTESLFSLLSFSGLYFYHSERFFISAFIWALSALVRSNGILYVGYFIFNALFIYRWSRFSLKNNIFKLFSLFVQCSLILSGFMGFQYYAYSIFCSAEKMISASPWCLDRVPLLYQYVQKRYWNCGFLTYFQISQLPNFLLAFPFIILSYWGIAHYAWKNPTRFFTLGISGQPGSVSKEINNLLNENSQILPSVYLWLVMVSYCLTSMHVQVVLRFLTSCPVLYWFVAQIILSNPDGKISRVVIAYWVVYGLVSIILFSNFYPPA